MVRLNPGFAIVPVLLLSGAAYAAESSDRVELSLITDEADAVLRILDKRAEGEEIESADWDRLFESEGYRRHQQRQQAFGRDDSNDPFVEFVRSDGLLERADALGATLAAWKRLDLGAAAARAFAYLPDGAVIRARIYPMIKPRSNSFVFEVDTNPAIFLYLDPEIDAANLENVITHELHHIGLRSGCSEGEPSGLDAAEREAVDWLGAFGEGLAMLAAAGSWDVHPHATTPEKERAVWERHVGRFADDLRRMERFFLDVADGKLSDDEARTRAFEFISTEGVPQGGFYTVGWRMGSLVERHLGREAVIECVCDFRKLLVRYNRIARRLTEEGATDLPLWSPELLRRFGAMP